VRLPTLDTACRAARRRAVPELKATRYHAAWQLRASQLVDAQARCPVCGSTAPRSRIAEIQRSPDVCLLQCGACGGCSASHLPLPEVLDAYYRRYFRDDAPKTTMPRVAAFVRNLLRSIGRDALPSHVRILDFGGGDGTLGLAVAGAILRRHPERTVAFTLVDYQLPAATGGEPRLAVTHRRTLAETEGGFDLVLASAVLEHIPELHGVMSRLFAALAPGGWFYARTPWMAPLKRLMPNLDLTFPGHVHDLGAPFWNRVALTFGQPLQTVVSRPSLVETCWRRAPARTFAAWLLKLPARVQLALCSSARTPWWRLVGGWEVVLRRHAPPPQRDR
jgi:SAM-dependent methyltransferase